MLLINTLNLLPGTLSVGLDHDLLRLHVLDARLPIEAEVRAAEAHISRLLRTDPWRGRSGPGGRGAHAGLLRFPDVYTRLHALTKADNLGLGCVVLGLALQAQNLAAALFSRTPPAGTCR